MPTRRSQPNICTGRPITGSAMMDDRRHSWKQPIMRQIRNGDDFVGQRFSAQTAPARRQDPSRLGLRQGPKHQLGLRPRRFACHASETHEGQWREQNRLRAQAGRFQLIQVALQLRSDQSRHAKEILG